MKHPADETYVVVQGAQRLSDLLPNEQEAIKEANRQRKLQEGKRKLTDAEPPIEVKQNLYG
jgi:hypothetical protein